MEVLAGVILKFIVYFKPNQCKLEFPLLCSAHIVKRDREVGAPRPPDETVSSQMSAHCVTTC